MDRKKILIAKARGITESIDRIGDENKIKSVTPQMAEDYNLLISLTSKEFPLLKEFMPQFIHIGHGSSNDGSVRKFVSTPFIEVHVYCNQIIQMLADYEVKPT